MFLEMATFLYYRLVIFFLPLIITILIISFFILLSSGCIQLCVKDITVFKNPDVALCMCMCACGLHFSSSSFNFFHPVKHPTYKTNQSCKRIYFTWHKKVFRIFVIPQFYLKMFPRHKCNSPDFCTHRGKIKLLCVVKS